VVEEKIIKKAGRSIVFRCDPYELLNQQICSIEFCVFKNLKEQPGAKCFSSMDGNNSAPAVIMAEEMVASLDADNIKSMQGENLDKLFTFELRKFRHS
jgi:hypothetical protein